MAQFRSRSTVTVTLGTLVNRRGWRAVAVRWRVRRKHGPRVRLLPLKGKGEEIQLATSLPSSACLLLLQTPRCSVYLCPRDSDRLQSRR